MNNLSRPYFQTLFQSVIGISMLVSCGASEYSKDDVGEYSIAKDHAAGMLLRNSTELGLTDSRLRDAPVERGFAIIQGESRAVAVQRLGDVYIYQGDIAIKQLFPQPVQFSAGVGANLWPDNIVHYRLDGSLNDKNVARQAIAHWESRSAFRFVEMAIGNYLEFSNNSEGCWSYIGKQGGAQTIQLAANCGTGAAIHEIGHALGLVHEQSRKDRDQYVDILWENIKDGKAHNFEVNNSSRTLGRYDFGSIMHYGAYSFSKNGLPTIRAKNGNPILGQRMKLSGLDVGGIRDLYGPTASSGVHLYSHSNFRGAKQKFIPGLYTASFNTLGSVGNDSASSIKVPFGYEARICSDSFHGYGFGTCKDYSYGGTGFVGANLNDRISYIRVLPVVTGYQKAKFKGARQAFSAGKTYKANRGELGALNNDGLSSIRIPIGMKVRICQHETGGVCKIFSRGALSLDSYLNNQASLIEVLPVIQAFSSTDMRGRGQVFASGIFRANDRSFYNLRNDSLSSLIVPKGLKVRICSEADGRGPCKNFNTGNHRSVGSDLNNRTSYIRVMKNLASISQPSPPLVGQ